MPNKVLIAIPTAPVLNYREHEKAWKRTEWDEANRRWDPPKGRLNGDNSPRNQAVRDTWWRHIPPDMVGRFFVGRTGTLDSDTVQLDCADTYLDLIDKIRGVFGWALDKGFDRILKCDDDTFIFPAMFDFLRTVTDEVTSCVWNVGGAMGYMSGGTGYVFGRKAMKAALEAPRESFPQCKHLEDHWMSEAIFAAGIRPVHSLGFTEEVNITPPVRYSFHPVSPQGMRQMYKEFYKGEMHD
jgi:hypothetical protein